jgi:hypothetical protein
MIANVLQLQKVSKESTVLLLPRIAIQDLN